MKNKLKQVIKHPLFIGTFIITVSTNIANIFSYIFQYLMLRFLPVQDFKILFNLFSLMAIITVLSGVMSQVAIKSSAKLKAKEDFQLLTGLFKQLFKINLIFALSILLVFNLFSTSIAQLLNLPSGYLQLFSFFVAVAIVLGLPTAFLNGLLRFKSYGFLSILAGILKVAFPLIAIILGYKLSGVLLGLIIAGIVTGVVGFLLLKKNLRKISKPYPISKIITTSIPLLLISLFTILFFNIDVLLVNKFFSSADSATYSSIALIGRIILYGSSAVSVVLMPIISEKTEAGLSVLKTLIASLLMVLFLGSVGTIILYIFPNLINTVVFGGKYPSAIPYLGLFGVFMVLYSLVLTITGFFIGASKNSIIYVLAVGALTQLLGIILYHNTINQIIHTNIISMVIILLGSFVILYKDFVKT